MTLAELIDLLGALGDQPGERPGLSELDHGLQCAHRLAAARPDDLGLQVAGLVHDIGHAFGPDESHGRLGAEQVREVLGERVASLVEAHVPAKRYVAAVDPGYLAILSPVSTASLALQGGPMDRDEVEAFRSDPRSGDAVVLRAADDAAKEPGRTVPPLAVWVPALRRLADARSRPGAAARRSEIAPPGAAVPGPGPRPSGPGPATP